MATIQGPSVKVKDAPERRAEINAIQDGYAVVLSVWRDDEKRLRITFENTAEAEIAHAALGRAIAKVREHQD